MEVFIKFNISNAAFADLGTAETARILKVISERIESGEAHGKVRDINGNKIGVFMHSYEKEDI